MSAVGRVLRGQEFGGVGPVDDPDPREPVVIPDRAAAAGTVPRASIAAPVLDAATARVAMPVGSTWWWWGVHQGWCPAHVMESVCPPQGINLGARPGRV